MDTKLIDSLLRPALYPHPVTAVRRIETHISWVLLTGSFAYKIKKPVNLGFLDFSTLEKREHFCHEELRINSRFAPQIYVDVVRITGSPDEPQINGPGATIEYAVRMHEFPDSARLDKVLTRGELHSDDMDRLAAELARIHADAPRADADSGFGTCDAVFAPSLENFAQIRAREFPQEIKSAVDHLEQWTRAQRERLGSLIERRLKAGKIRECHGDLHARNIAYLDQRFVPFDAIEFNANLRWIDVLSEVAFTVMDLEADHSPEFARRLLNSYLELTADREGLPVIPFYLCYRAMVRAKVAIISAAAAPHEQRRALFEEFKAYVSLAASYTQPAPRAVIIMFGVSGSGKSTAALRLVEAFGVIRLRSDYERKRLAIAHPELDLYSPKMSELTYDTLLQLASGILKAGFIPVLDATFLDRSSRTAAIELARKCGADPIIIECAAPVAVLRARVAERTRRANDVSDADLEVLEKQLQSCQPLSADEAAVALNLRDTSESALLELAETIKQRLHLNH